MESTTLSEQNNEGVPLAWLGDLLISIRKEQGITQAELAERIGSHQAAIARWEAGKYRSTTLQTILTVIKALGVEIGVAVTQRESEPTFRP